MTFQQNALEAIRASGGRVTSQRELLLDLLANAQKSIDAESLHQQAIEEDPTISLPTVYRTLHILEEAGFISSQYISSDHDRKLYRVLGGKQTYHFTCRHCGKVTQFYSDVVQQLSETLITEYGAEVQTMCFCASGLCADCQKELYG